MSGIGVPFIETIFPSVEPIPGTDGSDDSLAPSGKGHFLDAVLRRR